MFTVALLTFIAVFLVLSSIFLGFSASRQSPTAELKRRLRLMERDAKWHNLSEDLRTEIVKETPPFERILARIPFLCNTEKWLDQAGQKLTSAQFLLLTLALSFSGFTVAFILRRNYLLSLIVALVLLAVPFVYLYVLRQRRTDRFTEQLPDVLTMIARSLRAGHAFSSALELVGEEMHEPAGGLFKTAYEQQKLGLPITDTLINITERIESVDLRFFVIVISINTEVGGNLAETLDKLAETIRERLKIRRQVKVYTAQGRMSGYLLALLPIAAFVFMSFMMPGYEDALTKEKPGQYLLILAAVMQFIGYLIIRRIINIRI